MMDLNTSNDMTSTPNYDKKFEISSL